MAPSADELGDEVERVVEDDLEEDVPVVEDEEERDVEDAWLEEVLSDDDEVALRACVWLGDWVVVDVFVIDSASPPPP